MGAVVCTVKGDGKGQVRRMLAGRQMVMRFSRPGSRCCVWVVHGCAWVWAGELVCCWWVFTVRVGATGRRWGDGSVEVVYGLL